MYNDIGWYENEPRWKKVWLSRPRGSSQKSQRRKGLDTSLRCGISRPWLPTIMNIENKGHYPSFDLFVKLITMFDVSVDQFIHADGGARSSSCRKHIDVLLNSMNEKELVVIEATAEGIKKARETEVPEFFCAILGAVAKWQAITNPIILFLLTNRIKTIMRHILVFPKIEIY